MVVVNKRLIINVISTSADSSYICFMVSLALTVLVQVYFFSDVSLIY